MAKLLFSAECVFCQRVVTGEYDEGNRDAVIFSPRRPITPGHRLIVPRLHVTDAADDPEITADAMRLAAEYARRADEDFNLITSAGDLATQTVAHLHIHFVPRREGDGLALPWAGQQKPSTTRS